MTSRAENELLTKVGPGTPMGALMRQYWLPACLSTELTADGDPLRLMLLGEKLIAFRDSAGRIGVLDHRCPHRCASLFFGRNEEGGLRCVYHGWKFDTAGNCLEMPNLPIDQEALPKIKAKSYQVAERGGVVYVYMGERAIAPPLPAVAGARSDRIGARGDLRLLRAARVQLAAGARRRYRHLAFQLSAHRQGRGGARRPRPSGTFPADRPGAALSGA